MNKRLFKLIGLLTLFALFISACTSPTPTPEPAPEATAAPVTETTTETETETETTTETETETETEEPMEEMGDSYLARAMAGEFAGTVVVVDGPFADADTAKFESSIAAFEEATGIDIQYIGGKEFETSISVRVDAGNAPDIADFPQPGLLANFVASGDIVDASEFLSEEYMQGQYLQSWLDMATMEGPDGPIMAGVWHRFNGKSLVWYPQEEFEAAGYTIPQTWDEMIALMDQIVSDGDTPWCIGIESGTATGWAATDWMEEVMLRTTSLENYDAWVRGDLPFSSPEVTLAAETLAEVWFNDDYVFGGRGAIVSTGFGDSPAPMFEDPPKCWFHKQGNFITSFFPEGTVAGTDYGVFYLPPIDPEYGKPFLVAGDIMAMFNDRPEVRAVMEYFTKGEAVKEWLAAGGALSPHLDSELDWYGVDLERDLAALVAEATSVRFDGSDLMPGEVGAGSFWKGMTDWVSGSVDLETALAEIDASWPEGTEGQSQEGEETAEEPMEEMGDSYLAQAMAGEFAGTVVVVDGPFADADTAKFESSIAAFEEATGIDIQYIGGKEFETSISVRVDAGNAPDIADFPQPGLLANFVASGDIVDASEFLSEEYMQGQYLQSWLDMATMEGPDGPIMAGVWHRFNGKSLVWYPQEEFEAAGYTIPQTWDEMIALMDQIVSDGDTPWCIGIESGTATGWAATDWMEEVMLRTTSLENYDAWVRGDLPFSSPEVTLAAETLAEVWFNDDYVFGGRGAIVSTGFGDSPAPMFEDPPKCWFHKQGNFITSFFPEGTVAGTDYGVFYLPPIDPEYGKPFLVAGDIMAMFNDRPEVRAVMEYFTKGEAVKEWLAAGGALSPHLDSELDWYGVDLERDLAALVAEATSVRFDGSDLMPGEVGAGSFWKGMTDWVSGSVDLETALAEIDASWPR